MSRNWQIYYNAVFGAIGGLMGWLIVGQVDTGNWDNITQAYIFAGAGVGLCIGASIGVVEGLVIKRSALRAALGVILGGVVGMISGIAGLLFGEAVFLFLKGGLIGRAVGWAVFGLFLGLGQGLVARKLKTASYGAVGGFLAGFLGGLIYESMTQLFLNRAESVQMIIGALGLIIIGASLGGIIPLSVDLISKAAANWAMIKVLNGRKMGLEVAVVDVVTMGSYDGCDLYLPGDKGIEGKQAQFGKAAQGFTIKNIGKQNSISVAGLPVLPGQSAPLSANTMVVAGSTQLQFIAS